MFYITNLDQEGLTSLTDRRPGNPGQSYMDFKMDFPLQLEYIIMRPDDPQEYFSMLSVSPDKSYYAALTRAEIGTMLEKPSLHHHSYYELLFVLEGNVYQIIENERHLYTPGSCCLLNKNVLHAEEHNTAFKVAFLGISDAVLTDVYRDLTEGFFKIEQEHKHTELDAFLEESLSRTRSYEKKYIDFIPRRPSPSPGGQTVASAGAELSEAESGFSLPAGAQSGSQKKAEKISTNSALSGRPGKADGSTGRCTNSSAAVSSSAGSSKSRSAGGSAVGGSAEGIAGSAGGEVRAIFEEIASELLSPRIGSSHMLKALIAKLLYILCDKERFETKPIAIGTKAEAQLFNEIDRIVRQTNGRATRSFLENELHYSGDYLNKITRKYTGMSIHDFGMTICMGQAAAELVHTKKTIAQIADGLGFSNRTHFYKQFEKIYKVSPAQYRKNNHLASTS